MQAVLKNFTTDRLFVLMDQMGNPNDEVGSPATYARLHDGRSQHVITVADMRQNYAEVDMNLHTLPFEDRLYLNLSGLDEEDIAAVYSNYNQSLIRLTQSGIAPIVVHDAPSENAMDVRPTPVTLDDPNIRGVWRYGWMTLISNRVEEGAAPQLLLEITLVGVLFSNRFLDLDVEPHKDLQGFRAAYTVRPVSNEERDENGDLVSMYYDFDLYPKISDANVGSDEVVVEEPEAVAGPSEGVEE